MSRVSNSHEEGFTIVELMIATSVLSVILLLATAVMISIGALYYKGYNQAHTQDAVRSAIDQLTSDIQFSNQTLTPEVAPLAMTGYNNVFAKAVCVGGARYSYLSGSIANIQIGSGGPSASPVVQIPHMLWRDSVSAGALCSPVDLAYSNPESSSSHTVLAGTNGQELVPPGSRLLKFCVNDSSGANKAGSCSSSISGVSFIDIGMAYGAPDLSPTGMCTGGTGDQFCAVDNLTSSVAARN